MMIAIRAERPPLPGIDGLPSRVSCAPGTAALDDPDEEDDLQKIDYDDRLYAVYARGRTVSPAIIAAWMKVFAAHAPTRRPLAVLDLGSGMGRFTPALARTFGGPAYGVEPSQRMRQVAEQTSAHPAVTYLAGSAERVPLPADSCDVVLMYLVFHHLRDPAAAAADIARVLRPAGRVMIRSAFADRMPDLWWHQFFPRAAEVEREMFPTVRQVEQAFAPAGLKVLALESVHERLAGSMAEAAARLRLRAISTFEYLTERETEQGFAALDTAVAAETSSQPVEGISDLLVLG
jgi:ubiquinone/menaquinone biosynthesis C-methylase UbiE